MSSLVDPIEEFHHSWVDHSNRSEGSNSVISFTDMYLVVPSTARKQDAQDLRKQRENDDAFFRDSNHVRSVIEWDDTDNSDDELNIREVKMASTSRNSKSKFLDDHSSHNTQDTEEEEDSWSGHSPRGGQRHHHHHLDDVSEGETLDFSERDIFAHDDAEDLSSRCLHDAPNVLIRTSKDVDVRSRCESFHCSSSSFSSHADLSNTTSNNKKRKVRFRKSKKTGNLKTKVHKFQKYDNPDELWWSPNEIQRIRSECLQVIHQVQEDKKYLWALHILYQYSHDPETIRHKKVEKASQIFVRQGSIARGMERLVLAYLATEAAQEHRVKVLQVQQTNSSATPLEIRIESQLHSEPCQQFAHCMAEYDAREALDAYKL